MGDTLDLLVWGETGAQSWVGREGAGSGKRRRKDDYDQNALDKVVFKELI